MEKSLIYSEKGDFIPKNMELKRESLTKVLHSKNLVLRVIGSEKRCYRKTRRVLFVAERRGGR